MTGGSDRDEMRRAVLQIVRMIPYGRATSYGAIARAVGHPTLSRMIGRIVACDAHGGYVPAHRVVNSQGVLTGRSAFGHPARMRELLEEEGIRVVHNRIANWKEVFWDPITEIEV